MYYINSKFIHFILEELYILWFSETFYIVGISEVLPYFSGSIKVEDLFYYVKHKDQFYRNLKRKDYQEAVEQIEAEIKDAGTDGNNDEDVDTEASVIFSLTIRQNITHSVSDNW